MLTDQDDRAPETAVRVDRLRVRSFADADRMGFAAARAIAEELKLCVRLSGTARAVFAAAPSQAAMLGHLVRHDDMPWRQITAFHLDDYLGLPADAPQRFANWLEDHLFSKVPFHAVKRMPAEGPADDICKAYTADLTQSGIDVACIGIGVNGHIAFNDPHVADFNDPHVVKAVELDDICRQQQVDDGCFATFDAVPDKALTLTIPTILSASKIFCVVPGAHKRDAVRAALYGPVDAACPASILRTHSNATLFLDREANPDE